MELKALRIRNHNILGALTHRRYSSRDTDADVRIIRTDSVGKAPARPDVCIMTNCKWPFPLPRVRH